MYVYLKNQCYVFILILSDTVDAPEQEEFDTAAAAGGDDDDDNHDSSDLMRDIGTSVSHDPL